MTCRTAGLGLGPLLLSCFCNHGLVATKSLIVLASQRNASTSGRFRGPVTGRRVGSTVLPAATSSASLCCANSSSVLAPFKLSNMSWTPSRVCCTKEADCFNGLAVLKMSVSTAPPLPGASFLRVSPFTFSAGVPGALGIRLSIRAAPLFMAWRHLVEICFQVEGTQMTSLKMSALLEGE